MLPPDPITTISVSPATSTFSMESDKSRRMSGSDYDLITEDAMVYFNIYVDSVPETMASPSFHEDVYNYVDEAIIKLYASTFDKDIDTILRHIVADVGDRFFETVVPRRAYAETGWYERQPDVEILSKKIDLITSRPQPDQRTGEWYRFRHSVLTASNAWKAFSTKGAVNQLIYEKCKPLFVPGADDAGDGRQRVAINSPMHWGQKYEPLSTMLYESWYGTTVGEFGCVPHATISHLAASPDGINVDKTSSLYGRMLEIKNIVNRDITGNPKFDYWIQMQLQMEVCDLNDCDFFETRFKEYENAAEYEADTNGAFNRTKTGTQKGIALYFDDGNGFPVYCFAPIVCTAKELIEWEKKTLEEHKELTWIRNLYWRLDEYSCVLVMRNTRWFEHAEEVLADIWKVIQHERVDGYEHRAPKRRSVPKPPAPSESVCGVLKQWEYDISGVAVKNPRPIVSGDPVCLIDISGLE